MSTDLSTMKLWDRGCLTELVSRQLLEPVEPRYCIVMHSAWEDPDDLDAPVKITHLAPL